MGKLHTNGNIQSKMKLMLVVKNSILRKMQKLNAENDITLATNSLINEGEIIAGKDMRIFSNTIKNTGEKLFKRKKICGYRKCNWRFKSIYRKQVRND